MNNRRSNDNDKNKLLYDPNQREQRRLGAFSNVENEDYDEDVNEEENEELENDVEPDVNNEIEDTRTSSVPQKIILLKILLVKKLLVLLELKQKLLVLRLHQKLELL